MYSTLIKELTGDNKSTYKTNENAPNELGK